MYKPAKTQPWMSQASCTQIPAEEADYIFYSGTNKEQAAVALRICKSCPVIYKCRAYCDEVENHKQTHHGCYGIWGGETPTQRAARRRQNPQNTNPMKENMTSKKFTFTTAGNQGYVRLNGDLIELFIPGDNIRPAITDILPLEACRQMIEAYDAPLTRKPWVNDRAMSFGGGKIRGLYRDWWWGSTPNGELYFSQLDKFGNPLIHARFFTGNERGKSIINNIRKAVKHANKHSKEQA